MDEDNTCWHLKSPHGSCHFDKEYRGFRDPILQSRQRYHKSAHDRQAALDTFFAASDVSVCYSVRCSPHTSELSASRQARAERLQSWRLRGRHGWRYRRYYPGDLMHGGMFLHPATITRVGSDTYVNLWVFFDSSAPGIRPAAMQVEVSTEADFNLPSSILDGMGGSSQIGGVRCDMLTPVADCSSLAAFRIPIHTTRRHIGTVSVYLPVSVLARLPRLLSVWTPRCRSRSPTCNLPPLCG